MAETPPQFGNLGRLFPGGFAPLREVLPEDPSAVFLRTLQADGLLVESIAGGDLVRVGTKEDRRGQKSGWYIYHADGLPVGIYGDWRAGWERVWCGKTRSDLKPAEYAAQQAAIAHAQAVRAQTLKKRHDQTAARATKLFEGADLATVHPYLTTKGVAAHGLRIRHGVLLIPLCNSRGEIRTLQRITPDGGKRYLAGGEKHGNFHLIGAPRGVILICEGYATGASLHEATGHAVAVASDKTNLAPVGSALRALYPAARIVFCGDDDRWKDATQNPGARAAESAAHGVSGATWILPQFRDDATHPTDFNDLAQLEGLGIVRAQVETAVPATLDAAPASLWADQPVPVRQWLLEDWIPMRQTTALYGDGGVGKTLLAQQLATAVASHRGFLGLKPQAGAVLGIFCEDDVDTLHMRQDGINRALGIGYRELAEFHVASRVGRDNLLMTFDGHDAGTLTPFWHEIDALVAQLHPVLVIVDTAADTFGGNENIRPQVRQFVQQALTALAQRYECAVLLCAHPSAAGLQNGQGTGGSTAWSNSVRSRLYLAKDQSSDRTILTRKKSNYAAAGEEIPILYAEGAFLPYTPGDLSTMPLTERAIEADFIDLLNDLNARHTRVSDSQFGRRWAPAVMHKVLGQRGQKRWTIEQLDGAMERLLQRKELRIEIDPRKGTRWIITALREVPHEDA
jgi:phage/plasmid primase-like uncharacterized protein